MLAFCGSDKTFPQDSLLNKVKNNRQLLQKAITVSLLNASLLNKSIHFFKCIQYTDP